MMDWRTSKASTSVLTQIDVVSDPLHKIDAKIDTKCCPPSNHCIGKVKEKIREEPRFQELHRKQQPQHAYMFEKNCF